MSASRLVALAVALVAIVWFPAGTSADVRTAFGLQTANGGSSGYGSVAFRIKVPRAATAYPAAGLHRRIAPRYVSAGTKSVAVLTDGNNRVVADVNPVTGFASVYVRAPDGTHTFTVTAYDQLGSKGNILSTGTTAPVVVQPVGYTNVFLTLEGVVASVALTLAQTHPTVGRPATIDLEVVARDADGYTILPGSPLAQPFTLTSSDPVNGKLSQTSISVAESAPPQWCLEVNYHGVGSQGVSVAYSGANVSQITFSASGAGLKSVVPAVLAPLPSPSSGQQIIVTGGCDAKAAFSTSNGNQLLATLGASPKGAALKAYSTYGASAVDTVAGLVYVVRYDPSPNVLPVFDIYQTSGAYALVDSFSPGFYPASAAIDPVVQKLFVSPGGTEFGPYLWIFSTTSGHALITRIYLGTYQASLAVDPIAHRLYVASCGIGYNCGGSGLRVFGTDTLLEIEPITNGDFGPAAIDAATGKLYVIEYTAAGTFIDVFATANMSRIARTGPVALAGGIALDSIGRRLYVVRNSTSLYGGTLDVYGLDTGLSLLGSITVAAGSNIVIAPYTP